MDNDAAQQGPVERSGGAVRWKTRETINNGMTDHHRSTDNDNNNNNNSNNNIKMTNKAHWTCKDTHTLLATRNVDYRGVVRMLSTFSVS